MTDSMQTTNSPHWNNLEQYLLPVTEVFPEDIFPGDERVKLEIAVVREVYQKLGIALEEKSKEKEIDGNIEIFAPEIQDDTASSEWLCCVTNNELISDPDQLIESYSLQTSDYPHFPIIDDNDYPEPLTPESPKFPQALHCLMPNTAPPHISSPSSEEITGDYNFKLTLETQPKKVANPDWIYSSAQNKLYIKPQTPCPMKFSTSGEAEELRMKPARTPADCCPPQGTYIRAIPIFKLPEHAKDVVRCCPNHTLLEQNNRATDHPASAHFIRSDNPQAEYEQCVQSGRLSVRIPFLAQGPADEEVTVHELFSFICNNSCGGLNRRAIQVVYTLETGDTFELLGRCAIEIRVCACPGRDSKQDNEAVNRSGRKKRKISGDVSSSTSVSPFSTNDLCPSPSHSAEDNTVYNLKVCGYVNYLILRKIAFALEFFANMKTRFSNIPFEEQDIPDFFDERNEQPLQEYEGLDVGAPVPRPIPQSSPVMTGQQSNPTCAASTNSAQIDAWYRSQAIPQDCAGGSTQASPYMGCYTFRRVTLSVEYSEHKRKDIK